MLIAVFRLESDERTGVVYFAEDGDGVDGGAVPASVAELLLTLVYRDDGARLYRRHHLHVASADVPLPPHQAHQLVALRLRADLRHRSRRRYRPDSRRKGTIETDAVVRRAVPRRWAAVAHAAAAADFTMTGFPIHVTLTFYVLTPGSTHAEVLPYSICVPSLVLIAQAVFFPERGHSPGSSHTHTHTAECWIIKVMTGDHALKARARIGRTGSNTTLILCIGRTIRKPASVMKG